MEELNLIDLLDGQELPLKNRIDPSGYYAPTPSKEEQASLIPKEPLEKDEQYRFHFDMTKCVGCQCCVVACNEQNNNPASVNWRRVGEIEGGIFPNTKKFHLSMACNHCLDPSCLTGCPTDAYAKLANGVVKHQSEECIGCGYCTWNCPYGVPQYNTERNIVTKCDMCHSRLEEGELPACVASCPESAIKIEKVNVDEWRKNHVDADAPYVPESEMTLSTTRITLSEYFPENVLRANRHRIEPERPHASLVIMTVLTQLAVGGFLTLWLGGLLAHITSFLEPLKKFIAFGATGMLIVTGVALFAAVFHLGRPIHAYKALRMWKRSWLSREVLLFAIFSKVGGLYAALELLRHFEIVSLSNLLMHTLGGAVVLSGLLGVYASAKIYLVPARPAWNTIRTPIRFFLTGFILGPLFANVLYSIYLLSGNSSINLMKLGPIQTFLWVASTAGFMQLSVMLYRLIYLRDNQSDELYGSTFLLIHRFKYLFYMRIFTLILGCFAFPLIFFWSLSWGIPSHAVIFGFSLASFLLSLLSEIIGRYLFFVTVVPKNMPGSFFTSNVGGH